MTKRRFLSLILCLAMCLAVMPCTTAMASSPSIRGYSTTAQTVYTGPSSSNYASIGSISNGEQIYVLGQERGWYHIVYNVNSGGQKSGYVPIMFVTSVVEHLLKMIFGEVMPSLMLHRLCIAVMTTPPNSVSAVFPLRRV